LHHLHHPKMSIRACFWGFRPCLSTGYHLHHEAWKNQG